ncbi:MAG: hypothetical protein JST17_06600 [Bacteroidetes bacterium]|nr:hypothetical protein [Bacteroidota bacterium]
MIHPQSGWAQDNSPYSRYGLGDIVPSTNVGSRAMGGIAAGYSDPLSINFNNPASYALFQSKKEEKSRKLSWGRALLDIGVNLENRTLSENNIPDKFVAKNALFSYLQVGLPVGEKLGLSFGLRPITRISYKINQIGMLYDPNTQQPIDSALTEYNGNGGTYLASLGAGYKIFKNFSIGFNAGYLFGNKDYSTKRTFLNDSVTYQQSNHETKASFGNIYFNAGVQYYTQINRNIKLTLGAYGNWGQKLNASQDIIRETFVRDPSFGDIRLDSVYEQNNSKGKIIYPASYGVGFTLEKPSDGKNRGWQFGADLVQTQWSNYRYYNEPDSVHNKWELRLGGQLWPALSSTKKGYWNYVSYRAGFFIGPDYLKINNNLQQYGISLGVGLPLAYTRQNPNQTTMINVTAEYIKRGNNSNLLKENLFRLSVGFALSDLWFIKRKYD